MKGFAAGLLGGAWGVSLMPTLPPSWIALLVALAAVAAARRWRAMRWAAGVGLGCCLVVAVAQQRLSPRLPAAADGTDVIVTGRIEGLPERGPRRLRFRFDVERARLDDRPIRLPERILLSWYRPGERVLRPGQRWRLAVRLRRPHGFRNPGGFDYERWLFQQGIGATGYVRDEPAPARIGAGPEGIDGLRAGLRESIGRATRDLAHRGILLALTVGDRDAIGPRAWKTLVGTGTNHLVAISGLHIGLVALVGFWLGRLLWRAAGPARVRVPRVLVQAASALALATVYAALAGFSLPTQRALVMLASGLGATLLRRPARPAQGVAVAVVAVLLVDPLAPLSPGFWLSFGAVATILFLLAGRLRRPARWSAWLRLQAGIGLALVPLLIGFFGRSSLVAPAANLVAVPWMSLLVVPPALAGAALISIAPAAAGWLFTAANLALDPLWRLLAWSAELPLAQWVRPDPPAWTLLLALLGVAVLLAPRGVPGKPAALVACLPLVAWQPPGPAPGAVWLDLLDVGQGLSAVVRTRQHTLVYDTGPRFSARFNAGAAVVAPFLRAQGVDTLDALVISHGDNDHAGGRRGLSEAYPPDATWTSAPEEIGRQARMCGVGRRWTWDGVGFAFLHPHGDQGAPGNNRSCVLRVTAPGGSLLLTGDIERSAERALIARGEPVRADVVVAPHHGSDSSSSPAFVDAVSPRWVLYPVGYDNQWDFPDPVVVRRWRPAGSARTDCGGALHVAIDPAAGVHAPVAWRLTHRHYWSSGCADAAKSGNMRAVVRPAAAARTGG